MNCSDNEIVLQNIKIIRKEGVQKVIYEYTAPEEFKNYIKGENYLFVEFPIQGTEEVPKSVLTIPFVGIMSTATMLLGIRIRVSELDKTFYKSLTNIEHVFQKIYRTDKIQIKVSVDSIVECNYEVSSNNNRTLFFTGGVDATSALVATYDEKPILLNIWGGDLRLTDEASHIALDQYLNRITAAMSLDYYFIKTNAREMFDENALGIICLKILGRKFTHDWWSSIAHVLSMVATIAPFMYTKKIKTHYIGSSYEATSKVFDANNVELVSAIKYCSCTFVSVDQNTERNEKVKTIINFRRKTESKHGIEIPIELKVCWNRDAGINCCACEKCYRTIMNILANHANPNDYGFTVNRNVMLNMKKYLQSHKVNSAFWVPIQAEFRKEKEYWEKQKDISWILHIKINSLKVYIIRGMEIIFQKINNN